jgi:predicted permease
VVDAIVLDPLPFEEPDELVMVWNQFLARDEEQVPVSGAEYVDIRERNDVFSETATLIPHILNLTGEGEPERLITGRVSASLFPLLGVRPAHGRLFLEEEDRVGGAKVVLLTDGFHRRRFGGDPSIVGESLVLNGAPHTVVGVLPRDFEFDRNIYELFIPVALDPALLPARRQARAFKVFARLAPGVGLEAARANLDDVARQLRGEFPDAYDSASGYGLDAVRLRDMVLGDVRPALLALSVAVALVLLIACVNVANLLLARGLDRQREVAVRLAFGAGRSTLVRQFLTEGLLLSLAGGGAGLLLAWGAIKALLVLEPEGVPRLERVALDGGVVLFALGVSLLTGLVFGLLPVFQRQTRMQEALKEGGRSGSEGGRRLRARRALVVAEIALALAVTAGAGLMGRTFVHLLQQDIGFDRDGVLVLQMWLPASRSSDPAEAARYLGEIERRVAEVPGVQSAALSSVVPLEGFRSWDRVIPEGLEPGQPAPTAEWFMVSTGYFDTMGIPVLQGRAFRDGDRADSAPVVIVSRELAERFWPGRDPLGRTVALEGSEDVPRRIVGVAGEVRCGPPGDEPLPQVYLPYTQNPRPLMYIEAKTGPGVDPMAVAGPVRSAVHGVDSGQALSDNRTLDEIVSGALGKTRFQTYLFGAFAVVALALAVIGVYGLIAYSVSRRSREIGVRMALGAGRSRVLRSVVTEALGLGALGVLVGLPLAWFLGQTMASMLHGVGTSDLVTFCGVAVVLAAAVAVASLVPARRATRVSPALALRQE